jgi:hypothetical protein
VGGLLIMAVLALLFAAGLEIEGLERARKENVESHEWPAVAATVDACYLDRYYPFQKDGGGVIYNVQCRFTYSINGVAYKSTTETPGNHHSFRHPEQLPDDALRMEAWAHQHKKGSIQVVHYDPANPAKISLAGADDEIRSNTAAIALTSARQSCLLGIVLLPVALVARRMTTQKDKSDPSAVGISNL